MDRGIGDGEGHLGDHAALLCILHRKTEVPVVVESAERPRYICPLFAFHFIHQLSDISRDRIHPQRIETSFQHMCLDSGLVERGCPFADGLVRVLTEKEIHLLESTAVCLHPVETSHVDDRRSDFLKLAHCRHIFARRLPHIPVYQGEFYFSCHNNTIIFNLFSLQI